MTQEDKIIKNKLGVLRLADMLGNVSQACKVMGYSRDSFLLPASIASRSCTIQAGNLL